MLVGNAAMPMMRLRCLMTPMPTFPAKSRSFEGRNPCFWVTQPQRPRCCADADFPAKNRTFCVGTPVSGSRNLDFRPRCGDNDDEIRLKTMLRRRCRCCDADDDALTTTRRSLTAPNFPRKIGLFGRNVPDGGLSVSLQQAAETVSDDADAGADALAALSGDVL